MSVMTGEIQQQLGAKLLARDSHGTDDGGGATERVSPAMLADVPSLELRTHSPAAQMLQLLTKRCILHVACITSCSQCL